MGDEVLLFTQPTVEKIQDFFGCLRNNGCPEMPTNMKRKLQTEQKQYKPQTLTVGCKVGGRTLADQNGCAWAAFSGTWPKPV